MESEAIFFCVAPMSRFLGPQEVDFTHALRVASKAQQRAEAEELKQLSEALVGFKASRKTKETPISGGAMYSNMFVEWSGGWHRVWHPDKWILWRLNQKIHHRI